MNRIKKSEFFKIVEENKSSKLSVVKAGKMVSLRNESGAILALLVKSPTEQAAYEETKKYRGWLNETAVFTCETSKLTTVFTPGQTYSLVEDKEYGTLIMSNTGLGVRWNAQTNSAVDGDGNVFGTFVKA